MNHTPQFQTPKDTTAADERAKALAGAYARVFLSDDGKRVLADLRAKFGVHRLTFDRRHVGAYDPIRAAIIDGERGVMDDIESAIKAGEHVNPLKDNLKQKRSNKK